MQDQPSAPRRPDVRSMSESLTGLTVAGFKSIARQQSIEVRPLTILAGANSSGKSSMMQPLLLLKQTLEATFDPGALLLNGPNVRFTSASQFLSTQADRSKRRQFTVGVETQAGVALSETFGYDDKAIIDVLGMAETMDGHTITLHPNMAPHELVAAVNAMVRGFDRTWLDTMDDLAIPSYWSVQRTRCFLVVQGIPPTLLGTLPGAVQHALPGVQALTTIARQTLHVPGSRGNPERMYQRTPVIGPEFVGTFDNYIASVISHWQSTADDRLAKLSEALSALGLTWGVAAQVIDDTSVELHVGRLPRQRGKNDLVSIADVGFGVSQVLPVLVALLVAEPGQLVYIEQPELHLHPRAQTILARLLFDAAERGVRVVAETHSSLILLGIQTLVAEGRPRDLVKLHWFTRDEATGTTSVASTDLDETGAFDADWPEDFGQVTLNAESNFLNAAESRLFSGAT